MDPFDTGMVLGKYEVDYFRCGACGFIGLPEPHWLDEAYSSAIYSGDMGLLRRSRRLTNVTSALVRSERLAEGRILDWAGGYGAFTRMMRDRGYDCFTVDAYAQNLLAPGFDGDEVTPYDLVTAFEVMEHLVDPVSELEKITSINDRFFFTTQLQPETPPRPGEWYYYALESGQHIAFHTRESLQVVADRLGYELTTNGDNYHLFHRVPLRSTTRMMLSPNLGRASRSAVATARSTASRIKSRGASQR